MKIPSETYFVIVSRKTPYIFQADFRIPNVIANDKNTYYRTGDTTTKLEDAYKFESEDNAKDYLVTNLNNNDDYEVRQLVITYEVI
jgi:hypothetical protein